VGTSPQRSAFAAGLVLAFTAVADHAWPQAASEPAPSVQGVPPQLASPPPAPPDQGRKENPGLLNEIGKLLENSTSVLPALKSPKETLDDAADALSRLARSPGVKGRVLCPAAGNGAPDCNVAADRLCQAKGFRQGKSVDVDTTRNCSVKALLSGRKPDETECRTDTYVIRAVCQ